MCSIAALHLTTEPEAGCVVQLYQCIIPFYVGTAARLPPQVYDH